jgi:pimeloyl-ACP methyl ester carboxylesterase
MAARLVGRLTLRLLTMRSMEDVAAEAIVRAPNAGRSRFGACDDEVRVEVGPPSAVLSIRLVNAPQPRHTVFVLHGIRDSKESVSGWGETLALAGFRAVLVDLRGHGRSTGETLTYGVRESLDLVQVLDSLIAQGLAVGDAGVMGHSYGAATAIQWASRDPRVRAVVAVAPFARLLDVLAGYSPLPLPASFVRRSIELAGLRGDFDPTAASPMDAIARTRARVLLIHGRADTRIPPWHSERIHAAGKGRTELVLVEGAGHLSIARAKATRLAERASSWFAASLAGSLHPPAARSRRR